MTVSDPRAWLHKRIDEKIPGGAVGLRLCTMAMVDSVGTGAFLAISAIFLTRSVGLSVAQVSLGLSLLALVGLGSTVPAGVLADRYGPRRVLVIVSLWRAACFVAYPFVHGVGQYLALACLLGLVDKVAAPMEQALVGRVVPESDRVHAMAVMRSMRNVGFTVGAMLGSVPLVLDTWLSYAGVLLVNAASFVVLAVIAVRLPLRSRPDVPRVRSLESLRILSTDRPYLLLAGLNALLMLHMPLLSIGLPVWIAEHSHAPRAIVGPLLMVNTLLVVTCQIRASKGSEMVGGAARRLWQAGLALGVCCLLLAILPPLPTVPAVGLLVISMIALTGGELFQSAGGWGLSYRLAQPGQEAAYLSLFSLGTVVMQIAAPLMLAGVVVAGAWGWVVLAMLVMISGWAAPAATRWAVLSRADEAGHPPAVLQPSRRCCVVRSRCGRDR